MLYTSCVSRTANQEHTGATYRRFERILVLLYLVGIYATLGFFIHTSLYFVERANHGVLPFSVPPPVLYAPEAYRTAMPALAKVLVAALPHVSWSVTLTAMYVVFGFVATLLLYRSMACRLAEKTIAARAAGMGIFLALLHFPMEWVQPWARPETLPTAFYLAAAIAALGLQARRLGMVLLFALTVWQGFVRADVAFVFGVAMILGSVLPEALRDLGPRSLNVVRGVGVAAVAAGVQLYLQVVRFPHLSYSPGTKVVQVGHNLSLHGIGGLVLALVPVMLIGFLGLTWNRIKGVAGDGRLLDSTDRLILLASALYLPVWLTVGIVGEIRIYVPFLLALAMVGGRVAAGVVEQFATRADDLSEA